MYAVIKTGGKQYRVSPNAVIDVELLEVEEGTTAVEFREVLFVGNEGAPEVGTPYVPGYVVRGEILQETLGPKVVSVKYKPRQNERRKFGHRQHYTQVQITEIVKV